ncbi:MAG: DUF4214 domain-containing protein [Acidobacteria bacterium]|nr:DUF4214 domain-containing protein [Acidobacteriota bacterium]
MRLTATILLLTALILGQVVPARAYTFQFNSTGSVQVKWPTRIIIIALSNSLTAPQSHIKAGSDAIGAARRALAHWADAANIQFVVQPDSAAQTIGQDGVSLITVATANATQFSNPLRPGRSRIFFDPNTGAITEADLAINPNVARIDPFTGATVASFFSTDGTPGSYDLESTFTHEIGHMLGLEHSAVLSATMQPRQGVNGTYNLPAQTTRTLSDDDRAGIAALYNPQRGTGAIQGTVNYTGGPAVFGAHVWAEELTTGRVLAGNITPRTGAYRIENLPPGQYRVVAEYLNEPVSPSEIASSGNGLYTGLSTTSTAPFLVSETQATVAADATVTLPVSVNGSTPFLNPTFVGRNGQLSTIGVPLVPGERTSILVGGDNLVSNNGGVLVSLVSSVSTNSPFIVVNSIQPQIFGTLQVLSVDVSVAGTAPPGDYSVRLASTTGEVAYVSGGLTIDLPNGTTATSANPIDAPQFFVAQHYRDFLNREPDAAGLSFWTNQLTECGGDAQCRDIRRVNVSAAFFLSIEFQQTGYLVYRIHKAAFGNLPGKPVPVTFQEFLPETRQIGRGVVVGAPGSEQQLEANKQAFFNDFVNRADFMARYPTMLSPEQFVDTLNANAGGALSQAERDTLVNGLRNNTLTRAQVLRAVSEDPDLSQREFNPAFVLMEYFGYLRRNPDDAPDADFSGYFFWLNKLNSFGGNFINAEMVRAFITSGEYRARFGPA